jgi:putative ABC transport system permease protein
MQSLPAVSLASVLLAFIPSVGVLLVMRAWSLGAGQALWANVRMLAQLLAVGYVLTFVFETENPLIVAAVIALMLCFAAWIALRPLQTKGARKYLLALAAIGICGLLMLLLVTQIVFDLPSWFEPRFVIPIAGMIFANAMNTTSLAAERFESEVARDVGYVDARTKAMDAALIPQINALLAVGLVSLPGMMTGQILSGVEPLVAVRYQIIVMCMIFGSSGLAAAGYLVGMRSVAINDSRASFDVA